MFAWFSKIGQIHTGMEKFVIALKFVRAHTVKMDENLTGSMFTPRSGKKAEYIRFVPTSVVSDSVCERFGIETKLETLRKRYRVNINRVAVERVIFIMISWITSVKDCMMEILSND